jgi:hypothetical protein
METDSISTALRASCMKAKIFTSAFGVSVTVPDASREVERDNGAIRGAAKVLANRLAGADDHDQAVRKAQAFCKKALDALSMPYVDQADRQDSWRLLPTRNYEALLERLLEGNRAFRRAIESMRRDAPSILETARTNLGDLANEIKLPTAEELVDSYKLGWTFEELPSGVVPGVPDYARAKLQRDIDAMLTVAGAKAREHTLRKFVGPLEKLVEGVKRLDEYDEAKASHKDGEEKPKVARFKDSLVGNISEMYETLGSLNVLNDPDIEELGRQIASLAAIDPEKVKKHPDVRDTVQRAAESVLDNLNSWLKPAA